MPELKVVRMDPELAKYRKLHREGKHLPLLSAEEVKKKIDETVLRFRNEYKEKPCEWTLCGHTEGIGWSSAIGGDALEILMKNKRWHEKQVMSQFKRIKLVSGTHSVGRETLKHADRIAFTMTKLDPEDREFFLTSALCTHEEPNELMLALRLLKKPKGYDLTDLQ